MSDVVVCVGDRLGALDQYQAGNGTYVREGFIHAAIVGTQHLGPEVKAGDSETLLPCIEVLGRSSAPIIPKIGDVVTGKVLRVQQNAANCRIVCVGSRALDVDFRGVIRLQDVRATEIDKVVMQNCFRPGDIIRAEVVSLGDARSYYLTTARNELGVVYAKSVATGAAMVAISWEEMQCPDSKTIEKRKIATG